VKESPCDPTKFGRAFNGLPPAKQLSHSHYSWAAEGY